MLAAVILASRTGCAGGSLRQRYGGGGGGGSIWWRRARVWGCRPCQPAAGDAGPREGIDCGVWSEFATVYFQGSNRLDGV
jgi:hypothetical protein